jgi:hypothetical protein
MRRVTAGSIAFLAMTSVFVVLPVYAAPTPEAEPVEVSIDEVALGSVVDPADEAVVSTDGEAQPGGVSEEEATEAPEGQTAGSAPTEEAAEDDVPGDEQVVSGEELPGVPALTYAESDAEKFSTVGITWRQGDISDVVVQLRVRDAEGGWGEWTSLEADDVEQTASADTGEEARGGTAPYWTGDAYGIEVIVQGAGGVVPADVKVALIDPGESAADALPLESGAVDEAGAGTNLPHIIARSQWGADESIRTWDPEYAPTLKAATLHHTADRNTYSADDVAGIMRSIYAYHTQTRGWGDIGYNFIVDKFGRIFEGRYGGVSSTVIGAHAGGFNTGTFGVSMLGNYAEVDTPQVMLEAVASVMAWKLNLYGLSPYGTSQLTSAGGGTSKYPKGQTVTLPTVFAHRDVGSTTCPGQYAYNRMGQLRNMIAARSTAIPGSPAGRIENLSVTGDRLSVTGWTYDPDVPTTPIDVSVSVDGRWALSMRADGNRPDVGRAYPTAGATHGFTGQLSLSPGSHTVCVVFVNAGGSGANSWVTCRIVSAVAVSRADNPRGNVESVYVDGRTIKTAGWAVDPDALAVSLEMHAYVDGRFVDSFIADGPRPDIATAFPGAGPAHGWTWEIAASAPGSHRVCIYAINRNAGTENPLLRCADVVVSADPFRPVGRLESGTANGRTVRVAGWAYDPDAPTTPVDVRVYADGRYVRLLDANGARPDVVGVYPDAGPNSGFSGSVPLGPGRHTVCGYAVDQVSGLGQRPLGCRVVTLDEQAWQPVGNLDSAVARSDGSVVVNGWTWDPDAGLHANTVRVFVDGRWAASFPATGNRPDIAAAFPEAGAYHGFSATIRVARGRHTVCAYGVNVGHGSANPRLGCRVVVL